MAYYDKEVLFFTFNFLQEDLKPLGVIEIQSILEIDAPGENILKIMYPGRDFELKAKSS